MANDEIVRLNPKLVERRMLALLPKTKNRDTYVRQTISALWNHSNGFLLEEDLDAGRVEFKVNVSYSQLAEHCGCHEQTIKWRLVQLRDKWKLLTWKVNNNPKIGNTFTVSYSANGDLDSANRLAQSDTANETDSANGEWLTQLTGYSDSANRTADSANRLAPLSSVFKETGEELLSTQQASQRQITDKTKTKYFQVEDDEPEPLVPVHSSPQVTVLRAAPVSKTEEQQLSEISVLLKSFLRPDSYDQPQVEAKLSVYLKTLDGDGPDWLKSMYWFCCLSAQKKVKEAFPDWDPKTGLAAHFPLIVSRWREMNEVEMPKSKRFSIEED